MLTLDNCVLVTLPCVTVCSVNVGHSVDFEIESHIDLGINPKLCKYIFLSIVFVVFNVHSHSHSPQELKGIL